MTVLDIGCGTGFPVLEIASSAGKNSVVYGIDPSEETLATARKKAGAKDLKNVRFIDSRAEDLPFENHFFDLIVSNNGMNNVENIESVLSESYRTLRKNGELIFTVNLPGTFQSFYNALKKALSQKGEVNCVKEINAHIQSKRLSVAQWERLLKKHPWRISEKYISEFYWNFSSTEAFLEHPFIASAFRPAWEACLPEKKIPSLYSTSARTLDKGNAPLQMKIPFACFRCTK